MDNNHIASDEATELRNCVSSFEYFCENYVKITHPIKGLIPFKLYDYQKRYVKCLEENQFVIAKKFRQGGFTTLTDIYLLWNALFRTDKRIIHFSKTDREACDASKRLQSIIKSLPEWMRTETRKMNDHFIKFSSTASSMKFHTFVAACGMKADIAFIDEPAFFENMESHWKAIWPTLSCGGKCFAISTPNKASDWFGKTYREAIQKKNNFVVFNTSYKEHPDYNNTEWVEQMKANLGPKGWRQEILAEFMVDDHSTWQPGMEFLVDVTPQQEKEFLSKATSKARLKDLQAKIKEDNQKKDVKATDITGRQINIKVSGDLEIGHYEGNPDKLIFPDVIESGPTNVRLGEKKVGSSGLCDDSGKLYQTICEVQAAEEAAKQKDIFNWPHPQFNQDIMQSKEEFADMLDALGYPEFKDSLEASERTLEQTIKNIDFNTEPEHLVLAGVIDAEELESIDNSRPDREILQTIMSCGELQEGLKLTFIDEKLCINGLPTWMKENDMKDAYNGICGLTSHNEAVKYLVDLLKDKLKPLFRKE